MPEPTVETAKPDAISQAKEASSPKKGIAMQEFCCPPYFPDPVGPGKEVIQPKDMPQEAWEGLFPAFLKNA